MSRRAVTWAACAWAVAFGAPHAWWGLGVPFGFPGGETSYRVFMSAGWRLAYDWVVVAMSALAVAISLELAKPPEKVRNRPLTLAMAWFACAILSIRGVAGLIVDGLVQPFWTLIFVAGGIAMGAVAYTGRHRSWAEGSRL